MLAAVDAECRAGHECFVFRAEEGAAASDLIGVAEAADRGWLLNLEMTGHRVSEFPHKAHYDGALIDQRFAPSPGLWILEIQLRHPTRPFGAFYEDLLFEE